MSLDEKAIRNNLKNEYKNIGIFLFDTVDSTNNEAKRMLGNGEKGVFAVISDSQTAGRGRGEHSFFSPRGTGVYLSLVIHPDLPPRKAVNATTAAAVAVSEAIEKLTDKKPLIKWVNDIFIDGKKVCGILTEAVSDTKSIVIGVGINISTADFPDEIKQIAGSLGDGNLDRNILAAEVLNGILDYSQHLKNPDYMEKYRARSLVLGREISYVKDGVEHTATAIGIGETGRLYVESSDGKVSILDSGEISVKI